MKLIIAAALAASAIAGVSAPAFAQPYGPPPPPGGMQGPGGPGGPGLQGPGGPGMRGPGGWDIDHRIGWIEQRIARGRDDGSLDRREAAHTQRELNSVRKEERRDRYAQGGHLNDDQRQDIQARLDRLNDQLHWLNQNHDVRPW